MHYIDYIVFGLILLISASIGPIHMFMKRKKTKEEEEEESADSYFRPKKGLGFVPATASLFASFYSANSITSVPLELYTGGASYFMASFGQFFGLIIGALLLVPMFYKLQLMSSFQYYDKRYKSPLLRKFGTIISATASIFYLGLVTFAPCIALAKVSNIPYWLSVLVSAGFVMVYTVLGGIQVVVYVDLFQALTMFAGTIAALVIGTMKIEGGFGRVLEVAYEGGRLDFFNMNPDPRETYSFYATVLPALVASAQFFPTAQSSIQRYSSLPTVTQAVMSMITLAPQIILFKLILFGLALVMFSYYAVRGCDPLMSGMLDNPNQLVTHFVDEIFTYPGFVGLWMAALFSGALSTMSTAYNSVAAILWTDLLKVWQCSFDFFFLYHFIIRMCWKIN